MNAENQGDENGGAGEPGDEAAPIPRDLTAEPPTPPVAFSPLDESPAEHTPAPGVGEQGLLAWLVTIVVLGLVGLLFGQQELAALTALTGLFVAAQSADMDVRWKPLYYALAWLVPVGGVAVFLSLIALIRDSGAPDPWRTVMLVLCIVSAGISALLAWRPVASAIARVMFRSEPPNHELRLVARLVVMGLMLAPPGWYALRDTIMDMLAGPESALAKSSFGASLVGYVVLALASVGFLIRRDLSNTLERLGIVALRYRDAIAVPVGLLLLVGLNAGSEWIQRTWFPGLYASDTAISQAMARGLGIPQVLALGVTAGVGEEITIRGALQPKVGIVLAALLFAALHVQYSWFGMLVIFGLGLVLGVVRQRSSTSAAMIVHALYDILAVFST